MLLCMSFRDSISTYNLVRDPLANNYCYTGYTSAMWTTVQIVGTGVLFWNLSNLRLIARIANLLEEIKFISMPTSNSEKVKKRCQQNHLRERTLSTA